MTKYHTLIIALILLVPLVQAEAEYKNIGGTNDDFLQGEGGFNPTVLSTTLNRALTDGDHVPLIADLDGNGIAEIVIIDNGVIRLFQNTSLNILDSINLPSDGTGRYSAPILFDIDEDSKTEIIIALELFGNVTIFEWNGTDIFLQTQHDIGLASFVTGVKEVLLGCAERSGDEPPNCLFAGTQNPLPGTEQLLIAGFNATDFTPAQTIEIIAVDGICFSQVASMSVGDYDADGREEFVFSVILAQQSTDEEILIKYIDVQQDFTLIPELNISITGINPRITGAGTCQTENDGKLFTSPLLGDFDGSSGTGLETVIGYMVDPDEFRMQVFSSTGVSLRTHPDGLLFFPAEADGEIVGNVMIANIFADDASAEIPNYCVNAFQQTDSEITWLCGSLTSSRNVGIINDDLTVEYVFDKSPTLFNITDEYNQPTSIAHASNMRETSVDTGAGFLDPTEIANTYGVFEVTSTEAESDFFDWTKFSMTRIFNLDVERACTVVDYENIGASDLICTSDDFVTYIDDNLVNGVGAISAFNESPCIDQVVGINTTFQVSLVPVDQNDFPLEQDKVSTRVTLYDGSPNAQISFIPNSTSGVKVFHLFEFPAGGINQTGIVSLKYEAWDTEHPSTIDTISQSFTVATVGVRFGQCTSGSVLIDPDAIPEVISPFQQEDDIDNSVTRTINAVSEFSGLSGQTVFFVAMILGTVAVWFEGLRRDFGINAVFGITLIWNAGLILIGSAIGVISVVLVSILVLLGVAVVSIMFVRQLTSTQSS